MSHPRKNMALPAFHHRLILCALLLCIIDPVFAQARDGTRFLSHDGRLRWYHYHLPEDYTPDGMYPVVLNFHGGGGDASQVADRLNFDATADSHAFIAIYPQGVGESFFGTFFGVWNGGSCCGIAVEENIDDIGFVDALLDDLETSFSVDPTRIYATGISNGAMMSYRLACDLSHRIAAVAPIAGMAHGIECDPERPVPILHIHGAKDQCSLYDSRPPDDPGFCPVEGKVQLSGGCFQTLTSALLGIPVEPVCFHQPPVRHYISGWRTRNECPRGRAPDIIRSGAAVCSVWGPCAAGSEVILCTIKGGGHTWPGAPPPEPCIEDPDGEPCMLYHAILGVTTQDLDANELMWSFFQMHALP